MTFDIYFSIPTLRTVIDANRNYQAWWKIGYLKQMLGKGEEELDV